MRIDVADPGSERLAVVAALVAEGYDVASCELREVDRTRADLLVLAADAPDALKMLRRLRDDGRRPDVPVILLGTPEGTTPIPEGPGFGAELVLPRPVDEERLVLGVRRLLSSARPDRSVVDRVPEHTLELRERAVSEEHDDPSGVSAIRSMGSDPDIVVRERRPTPSRPPTAVSAVERRSEAPVSVITTGSGSSVSSAISSTADLGAAAPISDTLRGILAAADRRVFPGLAAIDVSIPAGEASARELVPDDLFDDAAADDEGEDEGLFVIDPLSSVLGASVSSAPPRRSHPPSEPPEKNDKKTSPGTPLSLGGVKLPSVAPPRVEAPVLALPEDESLGPLDASGVRRLALVPGAMLRALAALVLGRASTRAEIVSPSLDVTLTFTRGEISRIEGPVARLALARLGRAASDDTAARARLSSMIERHELSPAIEALALARGEWDVLAQVIDVAQGVATFHATRDEDAPAKLGSTGRALGIVAGRLPAARAFAGALADLGRGRLEPTRALGGSLGAFAITGELARLFEGLDEGLSRLELVRAARVAPELPGIAALLVAAGALRVVPGREEHAAADARAIEQLVREHAARTDDGDYFTLLGVRDEAGEDEIRAAHEGRRALLAGLPLEEVGLGALAPLRDRALTAIDEAAEILGDPKLRGAYARALRSEARPAPTA